MQVTIQFNNEKEERTHIEKYDLDVIPRIDEFVEFFDVNGPGRFQVTSVHHVIDDNGKQNIGIAVWPA